MTETPFTPAPTPASTPSSASAALHESYAPPAGVFDEMLERNGLARPHWLKFLEGVGSLSPDERSRRWDRARRLIRENGVTYNVYGDPRGLDRPWELDPVPLLISAQEWSRIEAGMQQRAQLFDAILADLYGPQKLLASGLVPAVLVFSHPNFLRACHGLSVPGGRRLHLYAADLARDADGRLFVVGDRTQSPSGAGYSLENRVILSRTFPDVFRECRVQRLARFFHTLRQTLASLAPFNRDNPRVVVLTPGPYNETYFEHAYLARYLGYTLAEGADLTVRDERVFLKTLGGLHQVDVILRRVDDDFCDPLELRGDSFLGVTGLVQAARAGNVAIANALGSGVTESAGLLPLLPTICRHVLGEELKLPSVQTWWCGDKRSREHVLANLDRLVIKPAFPGAGLEPIFGEALVPGEREAVTRAILARPTEYVGQERLAMSSAPVLAPRGFEPRHLLIRAFAVASPEGYGVLPGGLTRVAAAGDSAVASLQRGAGSKDTWVLGTGPVDAFTLLNERTAAVDLTRTGGDLPSRVGDNLFWLGRYLERTEGIVRLARGVLLRLIEQTDAGSTPELPLLLKALTHLSKTYPGFATDGPGGLIAAPEPELMSILLDERRQGSLASVVASVHRTAGLVRDRLSADAWRILYALYEDFALRPSIDSDAPAPGELLGLANQMIISLAAFGGIASESMTRGQAWRFLDMGRRVERGIQTAALLRSGLVWVSDPEGPVLEALLEVADSIMTYRRRYLASMRGPAVLDLLLTDETNPRSVAFQLVALAAHVDALPGLDGLPRSAPEQRLMLRLLTSVRLEEPERLWRAVAGRRGDLDDLLDTIGLHLPALSDAIAQRYLSHTAPSRQMSGGPAGDADASDGGGGTP